MDAHNQSEGIFTGILVVALLGPLLMFCLWLISPSQPPSPRPGIAREHEQHFAATDHQHGTHDDRKPSISSATTEERNSGTDERAKRAERTDQTNQSMTPYEPKITDWAMVVLTVVLGVIASIQAGVLWRQICDARLKQRAWVVFQGMDAPFKDLQTLNSIVTVKNTGETPAFIYRQFTDAVVRPRYQGDLSDDIRAAAEKMDQRQFDIDVVLAPGTGEHVFYDVHPDHCVNLNFMERIKYIGGDDTVFLIGLIRYRDTFDQDHLSVCCYRWNGAPDKKKFMGHRRHNQLT